jgi:hypothetical protein
MLELDWKRRISVNKLFNETLQIAGDLDSGKDLDEIRPKNELPTLENSYSSKKIDENETQRFSMSDKLEKTDQLSQPIFSFNKENQENSLASIPLNDDQDKEKFNQVTDLISIKKTDDSLNLELKSTKDEQFESISSLISSEKTHQTGDYSS